MKRSLLVESIFLGVGLAALLALTVFGAVYGIIPVIVVGAFMALVALWLLCGSIFREYEYEKFTKKFAQRDYAGALELLDKAVSNHFFYPVFRTVAYQLYVKGELAVDNLAEAAKYVDLLRRGGGEGWKYRTAFYVVLFNLDWGDFAAARTEFLDFEKHCSHSERHMSEIETLRSLIEHIEGSAEPYPESVKASPYPVVHRIVERSCQ